MGNQTEVAGRILITKSGNRRCQHHHTSNHLTGSLAQYTILQHLVLAVLQHTHVDMQTRASLTCGNLRSKGYIITQLRQDS